MPEVKQRTVKEWLEQLASSTTSDERDSSMMQNFLHRVSFPDAVCIVGIVYVDGRGSIDSPPVDIHTMARALLKAG